MGIKISEYVTRIDFRSEGKCLFHWRNTVSGHAFAIATNVTWDEFHTYRVPNFSEAILHVNLLFVNSLQEGLLYTKIPGIEAKACSQKAFDEMLPEELKSN